MRARQVVNSSEEQIDGSVGWLGLSVGRAVASLLSGGRKKFGVVVVVCELAAPTVIFKRSYKNLTFAALT